VRKWGEKWGEIVKEEGEERQIQEGVRIQFRGVVLDWG
jgi:hypothetical protein